MDITRNNVSHFENLSTYWRTIVSGNEYLKESTNISDEDCSDDDSSIIDELDLYGTRAAAVNTAAATTTTCGASLRHTKSLDDYCHNYDCGKDHQNSANSSTSGSSQE